MKLEFVTHKDVSHVELFKVEGYSLGLSIKDGTNEARRPVIKKVKPRSIAERSFSVAKGDTILSINGQDTKWMQAKDVRRLIKEEGPLLQLKLEYEIREACLSRSGIYRKRTMRLKLKKEARTFGFTLRKRDSKRPFAMEFPVISNIVPGGPAQKEGILQAGDRLLKVDGESLSWMSLTSIAKILRRKEEAEFLIEYNISVLSVANDQNMTELEIDTPDTDFGIIFNSSRWDYTRIYIEDIRRGSLAERCGAFSVGDIVLSINGVHAGGFKVSKANSMFHQMKEPIKIAISLPEGPDGTFPSSEASSSKSTISSSPLNCQSKLITGLKHYNSPASQHSAVSLISQVKPILGCKHCNIPVGQHSKRSLECQSNLTADNKHHNSPASSHHSENSPDFQNSLNPDLQHHNTPVIQDSISLDSSSENQINDCEDQINLILGLRNIIRNIEILKSSLSKITAKAFTNAKKNCHMANRNCDLCNMSHQNIQVCAFCLTNVTATCSKVMESIKNITLQFTHFEFEDETRSSGEPGQLSSCFSDLSSLVSTAKVNEVLNAEMIHLLIDNLPDAFADKSKLKKVTQSMKDKFANAEASCLKCKKEMFLAFLVAFKLLLLLSINEQSSKTTKLRKKLVNDFFRLEVPCTDCKHNVVNTVPSEKTVMKPNTNQSHLSSPRIQNDELEVPEKSASTTSKWKLPRMTLNFREKLAFYKLTDVQSETGTDITYLDDKLNQTFNIEDIGGTLAQNGRPEDVEEILPEEVDDHNCFVNEAYNNSSFEKRACLEKDVENVRDRCWGSSDSLKPKPLLTCSSSLDRIKLPKEKVKRHVLKTSISLPRQQVPRIGSDSSYDSHKSYRLHRNSPIGCSSENDQLTLPSPVQEDQFREKNKESAATKSLFNSLNTSRDQVQVDGASEKRKTHTEIMVVELKNGGKGFGFDLGAGSTSSKFPAPVIISLKPNSPAIKAGVLQKGDRVLAMNGMGAVGLSAKKLEELKKDCFGAEQIKLTVEFDVFEPEVKFGTFKVVLDNILKAGLEYCGKRDCSPWRVSGVLRGSSAHRSGQIFPGDNILYFRFTRREEFDPLTCDGTRKEFVELVVRREPLKAKKNAEKFPNHPLDEHSSSKDSPRGGIENSSLKRALEQNSKERDALVFNQEVTLFRDPTKWDFGFLVGENPETGQAYVTDMRPGGPAHVSGTIQKFDEIVAVNGVPIGKDDRCVESLISQANDKLQLHIRRISQEE